MKKVLKILALLLIVGSLIGTVVYLFIKNSQLNEAYSAATQQVSALQSKLDAVGDFADVYTVKSPVKMGQIVREEDFILQTIPVSTIPENVVQDISQLKNKYYRISFTPGMTITQDLFMGEEYVGSVYERDVFLDSLPVGTNVGDYIDVRVVLPGGEEFVVFGHRRVNARYENAIKLTFDEADLWVYTSMMVDKALYGSVGFNIYCTKYKDPGAHDKTIEYYPLRKEVTDIMSISPNLTEQQRSGMYNENLRASIDIKLKFYSNPDNRDGAVISGMWSSETSRYQQAHAIYEQLIESIQNGDMQASDGSLLDPNAPMDSSSDTSGKSSSGDESLGNLGGVGSGGSTDTSGDTPSMDGQTDADGNGSVIPNDDYVNSSGGDIFEGEEPIT